MDNSLVKLTVQGVWTDASPNAESQVVLLQDEAKTSVLPIWVGTAEGTAIRMALEGIAPPRPLCHPRRVRTSVPRDRRSLVEEPGYEGLRRRRLAKGLPA